MNPIASSTLRLIPSAALAVLVTGCSVAGSLSSPVSASSSAAVRANLKAADGLNRPQPFQRARSRGWLSPDAKKSKNLIYWGDYDTNTIAIYSAKGENGKEEGSITTGLSNPERLFVDAKGNVYATNLGNSTITAYKPGATSPFLTISDGVDRPTGLTVDVAGNVYCANVGNDTITVYKRGKTSPSLTISVPGGSPQYLATDKSDNLYASVGSEVIEFPQGSTSGTNLGLAVTSPGGLEVDKLGDIIVIDGESTIDYFPAGETEPSKQISAPYAFGLSLSKNEKELYVSLESGADFDVDSVAYPNGSTLAAKLTTDAGDWPVAASPDNALGK
ncbi:MAG TPA: hypothetical protein VKR56_01485 [Candidatus Cybelea sp.]|nr:hypothetical protein [Candidatus Cybelea sp.]